MPKIVFCTPGKASAYSLAPYSYWRASQHTQLCRAFHSMSQAACFMLCQIRWTAETAQADSCLCKTLSWNRDLKAGIHPDLRCLQHRLMPSEIAATAPRWGDSADLFLDICFRVAWLQHQGCYLSLNWVWRKHVVTNPEGDVNIIRCFLWLLNSGLSLPFNKTHYDRNLQVISFPPFKSKTHLHSVILQHSQLSQAKPDVQKELASLFYCSRVFRIIFTEQYLPPLPQVHYFWKISSPFPIRRFTQW